jgi:hypothetical protein
LKAHFLKTGCLAHQGALAASGLLAAQAIEQMLNTRWWARLFF